MKLARTAPVQGRAMGSVGQSEKVMLNKSNQVGRPLGKVSTAVLKLVKQSPGLSAREISEELQASASYIQKICHRLVLQRRLRVIGRERVRGSTKPVYVYAIVRPIKPIKQPILVRQSNENRL